MDLQLQQQANATGSHTAALAAKQAEVDQLQEHSQQQQNSLNVLHAQLQAMYSQHDALQHSLSQQQLDSSLQHDAMLGASHARLEELQQQAMHR